MSTMLATNRAQDVQNETLDPEVCWDAVMRRDSHADGSFVFGVRSTGIYCRPSCPARRPQRIQALFFAGPTEAEQAGFRQCRRCKPREASTYELQAQLVAQITSYIESHLDNALTLAELGNAAGTSPSHLQRLFKQHTGLSPRQYVAACRLDRLKAGLKAGESVSDAAYEAGYSSSSRLYEQTARQLGMTPATYRKGGAGMDIRYTIVNSSIGRLLMAATERGICMVSMGNADEPLQAALGHEFPAAQIRRDDAGLAGWAALLVAYLQGTLQALELPLDVQATAFQLRVWQALQAIPYGSTRTYHEIAAQLGQPKAARAVGRACATNPVSLVIPCHRAVREDGGLGGYRWGLERKRFLLDQEQMAESGTAR